MGSYFAQSGVHVLVDGQFGSTGKGVLAAFLAEQAIKSDVEFRGAMCNAGPNSGHTFYHGDEKHVLKQLPTFAVASTLLGRPVDAYLSAGSIIDPDILLDEAWRYPDVRIFVHPNASVIRQSDKDGEKEGSIAAVAGTRSGTGMAQVRKIMREPDAVWGKAEIQLGAFRYPPNIQTGDRHFPLSMRDHRMFMEVSQGFSLGINSQFYPKVTSRECTVMQGITDARIAPKFVTRTYMAARSLPIRVGNVDGHSSGDCYRDQQEISWESIGVQPELTTVTKRERRLFSFSVDQMIESVSANQPDFVFMNFMNYLSVEQQDELGAKLVRIRNFTKCQFDILTGWGPKSSDVVPF